MPHLIEYKCYVCEKYLYSITTRTVGEFKLCIDCGDKALGKVRPLITDAVNVMRRDFLALKKKQEEDAKKPELQIWVEDDATLHDPTAEKITDAYRRIVGEEWNAGNAKTVIDHGDVFCYYMGNGYMVQHAFDGYSIYKLQPQNDT